MNLNQVLGVFAFAAVVLGFSGISHADDCGKGTRVDLPECVTSALGSDNKSVAVVNHCVHQLKVKVDRSGVFCGDWAWTLDGEGGRNNGGGNCKISEVTCCGSSSVGGCDQTWASVCEDRWSGSPASASCSNASFEYDSSGNSCEIETECLNQHNLLASASAQVNVNDVESLNNCSGKLTLDSC